MTHGEIDGRMDCELTGVTVSRPSTMLSIVISTELVTRRSSRMTDGGMLGNTSLTWRTCTQTSTNDVSKEVPYILA